MRIQRGITYSAHRVVLSIGSGILLSLLAFALSEFSNHQTLVFFVPEMPGFFVAALTVGVHGDTRELTTIMLLVNAVFYGLLTSVFYSALVRRKNRSNS